MSKKHFKLLFSRSYEKTALKRCVHDFSVDCDAIGVDDILDIQKYLMTKMMWNNLWIY